MLQVSEKYEKWIWAAIFLIAAVLCFTLLHDLFLNNNFIKESIIYLDKKANTVLALTGASSSASVAITLMPGDVGNPIANELANISSYCIVILAAVHLEKYLITISALLGLRCLLPASFIISALNSVFLQNGKVSELVKKVCTFALALILVSPVSVFLSKTVEQTYKDDVQISIDQAQKEADQIKDNISKDDQNLWDKFLSTISGGTIEIIKRFETSLNNFVEAVSVMLITACAIPLLTFTVLFWIIKSLFQISIEPPSIGQLANKVRINPNKIRQMKYGDGDNE